LFATTIRENIVYGRDDATTEEIMVAAELANAAKFIDKLPNVWKSLKCLRVQNSILITVVL
jgi:ATP-binding cassette subfamily B (MDR/TAP) protein 1